ncbi:MAG: hypothetical protein JW912_06165 [Sedimentisphaerales bacterium]|nr:hypothetical protein [Sedimentisphaerales bacterium]
MNFIKKYIVLIVPVVIAVVAIAILIPAKLVGGSLKESIKKQSLSQGTRIKSLVREGEIPPRNQYEQEKLYQEQFKAEADTIIEMVNQSSLRELLDYDVFSIKDASSQLYIDFGKKFREAIHGSEGLLKKMKALDAPNEVDFRKETSRRDTSSRVVRSSSSRSRGADDAIIDAVCNKRAESILLYASPQVFKWYDFWEDYKYPGQKTALEDCWYSQVAYWIYQDVVETIRAMNAGSNNVYTSPVKRLYGVAFQTKVDESFTTSRESRMRGPDTPYYVLEHDDQILGVEPWTGRKSDANYDVVHFSVGLVVNSRTMMSFIQELCSAKEHSFHVGFKANGELKTYKHNQITVLGQSVEPVDRESENHRDYRYGDDAVVSLYLVCEYIFDCTGYDSLKPESVKELLGQTKKKEASPEGNRR